MFLKTAPSSGAATLRGEAERLTWLEGKVPAPSLIDFFEDASGAYLLMSAVPGTALIAYNHEESGVRRRMAALLGKALRSLHAVDISGRAFSDAREGGTERRFEADFGRFDDKKIAILRDVQSRLPPLAKEVLAHGDPCLPNVLVMDDELSGFVDVGNAGVGDPYRDLALALWSLEYNYGVGLDETFLEAYLSEVGLQ